MAAGLETNVATSPTIAITFRSLPDSPCSPFCAEPSALSSKPLAFSLCGSAVCRRCQTPRIFLEPRPATLLRKWKHGIGEYGSDAAAILVLN